MSRNNYPRTELRTIKRDGVTVHQGRYIDDPNAEWMDVATVKGDDRPRFYFGKDWREHTKGNK